MEVKIPQKTGKAAIRSAEEEAKRIIFEAIKTAGAKRRELLREEGEAPP